MNDRLILLSLTWCCSTSTAAAFVVPQSAMAHRSRLASLALAPDNPMGMIPDASFGHNNGLSNDFNMNYNVNNNVNNNNNVDSSVKNNVNGNDNEYAVQLSSEGGRPMHASVQEWRTSGHTPFKVDTYSQNADTRPFRLEPPSSDGSPHSLSIRNTGPMEFPLTDSTGQNPNYGVNNGHSQMSNSNSYQTSTVDSTIQGGDTLRTYSYNFNNQGPNQPPGQFARALLRNEGMILQGEGMVESFPISHDTDQVRIRLSSDAGYDVSARIEILQGPNCIMQEFDVYSENGQTKPFSALIDTPGAGSVVRIENTGPMTFPIRALVEPIEASSVDVSAAQAQQSASLARQAPQGVAPPPPQQSTQHRQPLPAQVPASFPQPVVSLDAGSTQVYNPVNANF